MDVVIRTGRGAMQEDNDQDKPTTDAESSVVDDWEKSSSIDTPTTTELELVSTQQLNAILASDDDESRRSIENAAASDKDGVLVRDTSTGRFTIVEESDISGIQADATMDDSASGEELSLVSSQTLRQIMGGEAESEAEADTSAKSDDKGGFDPYNSR